MGLLEQLKGRYKVLSIVGMAKNAGKTTALNYILEEAMDEGMLLGVTSTGRDGESSDLVTGTEKPRVFLDAGTLVSVPTQLYEMADAGLEILKMTDYSTAIGDLMICRVADSGYVQIAGPLNIQAHKKLCREMLDMGAEMILIDGAIDRKSIAAPEASDAIILATGAVLSRSLKKVVEETAHTVNLYTLPVEDNPEIRRILEESGEGEKILTISTQETGRKVTLPDIQTGLGASRYLDEAIGACNLGFVDESGLIKALKEKPASLEVILTGRCPSEALQEQADYITEMVMRRHPYERGIGAREGIEY